MARGVGAEAGQVDDRVIGRKVPEFMFLGPDQHRADEEVVPGEFGDDAHPDAMFGLRPAEQILDVKILLVAQRGHEVGFERGEMLGRHRLV